MVIAIKRLFLDGRSSIRRKNHHPVPSPSVNSSNLLRIPSPFSFIHGRNLNLQEDLQKEKLGGVANYKVLDW